MVAPYWDFKDGTAPSTPASGFGRLYVKNDGTFHFINDLGGDTQLGAGGGAGGAGIMLWEEGVPQATGTIINIVGDRIVGSISGTVIQILSTPDPAELIGIMGWSAGTPLGTGTVIDFGNNLTATLSGTVISLAAAAGGGAGGLGVMFWDEGAPQATGTILNVVGSGLTLSVSGTVAQLLYTLPTFPQEVIGVYGLDDGVPKGTGSWIDFGNNLSVTLSGTVLRVDAVAGGGAAGIGIYGQDEGVGLGTGTIMNVTSPFSAMTLSGTVLNLNIPNPTFPQELIGVYGQDEGVPLGTGTVLNAVGGGVTMSLSGTVLNLNVPSPTFPAELIGIYGKEEGQNVGTGTILNVVSDYHTLTLSGSTLQLYGAPPEKGFLKSGLVDGAFSGWYISGTAGAALTFGDLCYLSYTDSRWELADADTQPTSAFVKLGICVLTAAGDGSPTLLLTYGNVRADAAFPTMIPGRQLFVDVTAGDVTHAGPSGTGDVIRAVGYANTADELFFDPSPDWIGVT